MNDMSEAATVRWPPFAVVWIIEVIGGIRAAATTAVVPDWVFTRPERLTLKLRWKVSKAV